MGGLKNEFSKILRALDIEIRSSLQDQMREREDILTEASLRARHTMKGRARQNVVLEFGYFMGLLGRDRVCCLYNGNVELPSDMDGIIYISLKESINEAQEKIMKELEAAGFKIDLKE